MIKRKKNMSSQQTYKTIEKEVSKKFSYEVVKNSSNHARNGDIYLVEYVKVSQHRVLPRALLVKCLPVEIVNDTKSFSTHTSTTMEKSNN